MIGTYSAGLVALSIVLAVLASYVTIDLVSRLAASHGAKAVRLWLAGGALSMGVGIWSMHFIGMLALRLPIAMSYDPAVTFASLLIACAVSGMALQVLNHATLGAGRLLCAGAAMGVGIASMHYLGMEAMQMRPAIDHDPWLVALSILIAVGASICALWIAFRLREGTMRSAFWPRAASAVAMGAAIAGMHYTGMAAAHFSPDSVCTVSPQNIDNIWLAGSIAAVSVLVLAATLAVSVLDTHLSESSRQFAMTMRERNAELSRQSADILKTNAALQEEMREGALSRRALQESESRFSTAFDCSSIGVAIVATDGRWLQVNRALCQILGYSEQELLALSFQDITHPEDLAADLERARQMLDGEIQTYQMEKRYVHKDGHAVWGLLSVSLVRDEEGAAVHFISQVQDISARKHAEQTIRESEERFQLVVKGTHDGIWDWNVATGECYFSPRYMDLIGFGEGGFPPVWQSFESRVHPEDRASTLAALEEHFARSSHYDVEFRLRARSGEYRWFHARGQASWDAQGHPARFTGALRDVSAEKQAEFALARSQKFLDAVIDSMPQPVFVKDERHRWVLLNQRFCALLGGDRATLIGCTDSDVYPADLAETAWAEDDIAFSMKEPLFTERSEEGPDGIVRWMLKSKRRVDLPDGAYLVGIMTDITSQKHTEIALRESEETHRLLAENSSDMILRVTPGGTVTYVSAASSSMLGYRPDELTGCYAPDFIHPDEKAEVARLYGEVVRRNVGRVVTCRLRTRAGGWVWTETSFRPVTDEHSGRSVLVIGVSRNVEERVRVTEALNRFKSVLDQTLDMIFIFDETTLRITYVNQGAATTLGHRRDKLLGMAPWDLRADMTEAQYRKLIEPFLAGKIQSQHFETTYLRADGSTFPVDITMQLTRRPGETGLFVSVIRDASERKKVDRMKNEFVATVSHELRTPLTSIRGSLGLIAGGAMGELPPKAGRLVSIALNNSERLVRLVNDILDVEKIEAGKMRLDLHSHSVASLLEQGLEANRAYGQALGIRFELVRPIPGAFILVDGDRFMQVMANLLSNAAKFSPSPGVVELGAGLDGNVVRIWVRDHGQGIPAAFREKIFGKFSQADATDSRAISGTGLGLSIVKAIVEKLGGQVGFDTEIGIGTTFHVRFPEAPDPANALDSVRSVAN